MRPEPQTGTPPSPRVFNYSLDWRFLLPMVDLDKGYLLFEEEAEFGKALEQVGIHISQQLSFSDLNTRKNDRFPFLVLPFGLSAGWAGTNQKDRVEFYFSIGRYIDTGGYLLVGFNNALSWRTKSLVNYQSSTPRHITSELKQAGFKSVRVFGAMPDLQIPEYIFELEPQTIHFALQNRFRRKPVVAQSLQVLARIIGLKRLSHLLPCYFAVATT